VNDEKTRGSGESDSHRALVAVEENHIHSDVFERIVGGSDDIPGLVAYGIYQIRKREWIEEYQKERGHLPTREEVRNYSFGWRDGSLDSLRGEAEADMFRFAESVMKKKIAEMEGVAFNLRTVNEIADLKRLVRHCGGYRHHIVGHVIGFLVLVALAAAGAFAVAHEPTLREFVEWLFHPPQ
jgi:hypothetical protein